MFTAITEYFYCVEANVTTSKGAHGDLLFKKIGAVEHAAARSGMETRYL